MKSLHHQHFRSTVVAEIECAGQVWQRGEGASWSPNPNPGAEADLAGTGSARAGAGPGSAGTGAEPYRFPFLGQAQVQGLVQGLVLVQFQVQTQL